MCTITLGELLHALAIKYGKRAIDISSICDPHTVLRICEGLVRFDPESADSQVVIAHSAILEYLCSEFCRDATSCAKEFYIDEQEVHAYLTRLCVTFDV